MIALTLTLYSLPVHTHMDLFYQACTDSVFDITLNKEWDSLIIIVLVNPKISAMSRDACGPKSNHKLHISGDAIINHTKNRYVLLFTI